MTAVAGAVHSVRTLISDSVGSLQVAEVLFYVSGTYDQTDHGILTGVAALIEASRRNGKTVALKGVMGGTPATAVTTNLELTLGTVAIASADVTFAVNLANYSTEHAAAAMTAQNRPFAILVGFTES